MERPIWIGESAHFSGGSLPEASAQLYLGDKEPLKVISPNKFSLVIFLLVLCGVLFQVFRLAQAKWKLLKWTKHAFLIKRIGKVRVAVSDATLVPIAFRCSGLAWILIPQMIIGQSSMRAAVQHELQHHRSRDTWYALFWELFRGLFFFNPFAHALLANTHKFEEFACDEALVDRKLSTQAYGRCLYETASIIHNNQGSHRRPIHGIAGTAGMAVWNQHQLLRRVQMLNKYKTRKTGRTLLLCWLAVAGISVAAYASKGVIKDRRHSENDIRTLIKDWTGEYPLTINQRVLRWVNYYAGTPKGRKQMKRALARKKQYDPIFSAKLNQYNLPPSLLAVALMESGFNNNAVSPKPWEAAGVWQIIESTALRLGLHVDEDKTKDERHNIELSTDAAFRYLSALRLQFKDWWLATVSYNAGEIAVGDAIKEEGTRDAWVLTQDKWLGHRKYTQHEYLPKVLAGAIILNYPEILE